MTKISVIVPVYNTLNYLKECLDSVLNQTFEDFEIICINDGSTDSSLEILEYYKTEYDNITILNQSHKGLGAARNNGLSVASGEYILFLDSDDYLDECALDDLYNLANQKDLDLIFYKLINFDNNTYKKSKSSYFDMKFLKNRVYGEVFDWQTVRDKIFDLSVTAPGKLFKMDLIKNLKFPEDIIFEDSLFFIEMFFNAKRAYFYDKYLYFRRVRNDSIMNSSFNQFTDCITVYDRIGNHLNDIEVYPEFSVQLFDRKCKDIFTRFSGVPDEYKQNFYDKIKQNFLNKKDEFQKDNTLNKCNNRSLEIFNRALYSNSYREFELSVNLFDLQVKNKRYKKDISKLNKEIKEIKNSKSWKLTGPLRLLNFKK